MPLGTIIIVSYDIKFKYMQQVKIYLGNGYSAFYVYFYRLDFFE